MSVIYLYMDGVLVEFFGGLAKKYNVDHWKSLKDKDSILVDLRHTNFFHTLNSFDTSSPVVDYIDHVSILNELEWGICSTPLVGDDYNSAYWKRKWLIKHDMIPHNLENLIFTHHKSEYAVSPIDRRPNILIDDRPQNVTEFTNAGGIGIRYQANVDDFIEYLIPEVEKALDVVNATPKSSH